MLIVFFKCKGVYETNPQSCVSCCWFWHKISSRNTKAMPKELLLVVDKPLIQYVAEEAINAGIDTLIFVTGRNKRAIEDYFDSNQELEVNTSTAGKDRTSRDGKEYNSQRYRLYFQMASTTVRAWSRSSLFRKSSGERTRIITSR